MNDSELSKSDMEYIVNLYGDIMSINYKLDNHVWVRGQESKSWGLLPSVFRNGGHSNEGTLYSQYMIYKPTFGNVHQNDWLNFMEMQHYGIPTRLLDWTVNINSALYFCSHKRNVGESKDIPPDESATLWFINPLKLHRLAFKESHGNENLISENTPHNDKFDIHHYIRRSKGEHMSELPFPVIGSLVNKRIAAQGGAFTCHGLIEHPMESQLDDKILQRLDIPGDKLRSIDKWLAHFSRINSFTVFPDAHGLAKMIKEVFVDKIYH